MTVTADTQLAVTLRAEVGRHLDAAEVARQNCRAVWLRLFETHGWSYAQIMALHGISKSTLHAELKRAREERGGE